MASSSLGSENRWKHDVFLSFRGSDTRNTFTGHLYNALDSKGINAFIDNELKRGEVITSQLLRVIEDSRISIVVLSERYASSSFCLDELVKILESKVSKGQTVLPVFYHVDPTDVEQQTGTFGQQFAKLEAQFHKPNIDEDSIYWKFIPSMAVGFLRTTPSMEKQRINNEEATSNMKRVQKWRLALTEVAELSGWHLEEGNHEATTIQSIVRMVLKQFDCIPSHVTEHRVGLASRVDCILLRLSLESNDVRVLGLYGMGGMGKTTIAYALYSRCVSQFEFEGSCFLLNVRENSNKHGLTKIQEDLLSQILGDRKDLAGDFLRGMELIKQRVGSKKVFVVIDDVDHIEQLEKLAGELEWFGAGSIIIITTRDLHLLNYHVGTIVHEVKKLQDDEAMGLLSWHAFKKAQPSEVYMELSRLVVEYAQGHPLALKVLGSYLYGRNVLEWKDVLKKLKRCPNNEIANILKISYDSLDSEEKSIFLDIACLLKGKSKYEVIKFIDACGFSADIGVKRLIEKSLVYVDRYGRLEMHDLLEEMATQIDQASHVCIRKREDIPTLFSKDKSANDVEILVLDLYGEEEIPLKWLKNLTKLRALAIRKGRFIKMPKKIPNNIRWFEWRKSYLKSIPSRFLPPNLVVLKMPCSNMKKFFTDIPKAQQFMNLTHLNLSRSKDLREMMDFSSIPNLQVLDLSMCEKLKKIHNSIESLKKLEVLELWQCRSLRSLPNLVENQRLLFINVEYCSKLENLSNLPTTIACLHMNYSGIKEIPWFIENLINLKSISASNCENLICVSNNIYKLSYVSIFSLSNCPNLSKLPEPEGSMVSSNPNSTINYNLLDLSGNNFVSLPINTFKFIHIRHLNLKNCEWLVQIPELSHSLLLLEANNCKSLVRFSQFQFDNDFKGNFVNCHKIGEIEKQSWKKMIETVPLKRKEKEWKYSIVIPGSEIPGWFSYAFQSNHNLIAIAFCAVFQFSKPQLDVELRLKFSMGDLSFYGYFEMDSSPESEHMWLGFYTGFDLSDILEDDEEISCNFRSFHKEDEEVVFKRVGVHLI